MKNIDNLFSEFIDNLSLTDAQSKDAKTKYTGVIDCLAKHFYDRNSNSNDQFLFGSYKTRTNIRPIDDGSDVDVLFKIDEGTYEKYEDNPSGLLQEVRKTLKDKYTTTEEIHAWRKVVLVKFSDGHHNVEVLPAFENNDDTFKIPNTENGGSWEEDFNPREQVDSFCESNKDTCGLTQELTKIIKNWVRNTSSLTYKSYQLVTDVIDFLSDTYPDGKGRNKYDEIVQAFLIYTKNRMTSNDSKYSHFETAITRANKAVQYENEGKHIEASEEWRKVFDDNLFPKADENEQQNQSFNHYNYAPKPWNY
jgi:hypothetical protein